MPLIFRWATTFRSGAGIEWTPDQLKAAGWEVAGFHPLYPSSVLMWRIEAEEDPGNGEGAGR